MKKLPIFWRVLVMATIESACITTAACGLYLGTMRNKL